MDALIVSIRMILVGIIFHPTKTYMYSLSLENEPTSSNSHLTRNEKWKIWVGWHGSSCWLLCLCVLCFVFCAASKTIRCSRVSHPTLYVLTLIRKRTYIYQLTLNKKRKMKIMGRVARLILLVVVSVYVVFCVLCCLQNNPVFSSVTILSHISKSENYELCILAGFFVTTGKKKVLVVCLAGARSLLRPEKKKSSRLSCGCAIVITTGKKKVLVVCLAGARSSLWAEKRSSSRLSGGCAIIITTGKKKI